MQDSLTVGVIAPQWPHWRVSDVARYFGVKRGTVYKWVYAGQLPFHRTPGGGLRFIESDVKAAQLKKEAA